MIWMVFDVEAIGIHGEGYACGWWVVNEQGKRIASACYACDPVLARGADTEREWVMANVPRPHVGYNCRSPRHVRDEFWDAWIYAKKQGACLAADVPWPVEARFLAACIDDDREARETEGPYPLIDIASVRLAAGLDPLETCERLAEEEPPHNPMQDARQSARLLLEALNGR